MIVLENDLMNRSSKSFIFKSTFHCLSVTKEVTGVRIDVKPGRHSVSVHDAVSHVSVHPHVGVVRLDAQDKRPWRLVLQHRSVQTVVLTLREQIQNNGFGSNKQLSQCFHLL